MLTFQDQYQMYQQLTDDYSAAGLVIAKRDINEGGAVFLNRLGRKFNKEYLTTSIQQSKQYYQFAGGVLRISEIRILNGTNYYTPELITDELEWNRLNTIPTQGSYPTSYYIRGFNEVGIYPIPSADLANAMQISYDPQHIDLTQDDFTTGTITVTQGLPSGNTITHSGTGFTQSMVGQYFQTTDGTDGRWYRIGAFVSTSVLTLDNYYEGLPGSHTFRIGQIMKIPDGYQDAPVYYACSRYYMIQNDQRTAPAFDGRFESKLREARSTYGRSTSRNGVRTHHKNQGAFNNWIWLTPPISYP